jgi:hypothetical protein
MVDASDAREATIDRYREKILQDAVYRLRHSCGVTVQWGCVSLSQPEHTPLNNLILNEFLMVLA